MHSIVVSTFVFSRQSFFMAFLLSCILFSSLFYSVFLSGIVNAVMFCHHIFSSCSDAFVFSLVDTVDLCLSNLCFVVVVVVVVLRTC